jgi:hypothetical protein
LECQRDHIVVPGHHGMLPWRRDTAWHVIHFLRTGRFNRSQRPFAESLRTPPSSV